MEVGQASNTEKMESMVSGESVKTVKFSKTTDEKFVTISRALGRSKRELFSQMVDYFYKNKKDPTDLNDDILKNTLSRSHKTYIGFIKNQEDLLLIPMKEAMDKMIANQKDIVRFFNEQVLGANKTMLKHQLSQQDKFSESEKLMKTIQMQLDNKAVLKVKMLQIINGYIKAREDLGSFKSKEKEELAEQVRKQIEHL